MTITTSAFDLIDREFEETGATDLTRACDEAVSFFDDVAAARGRTTFAIRHKKFARTIETLAESRPDVIDDEVALWRGQIWLPLREAPAFIAMFSAQTVNSYREATKAAV